MAATAAAVPELQAGAGLQYGLCGWNDAKVYRFSVTRLQSEECVYNVRVTGNVEISASHESPPSAIFADIKGRRVSVRDPNRRGDGEENAGTVVASIMELSKFTRPPLRSGTWFVRVSTASSFFGAGTPEKFQLSLEVSELKTLSHNAHGERASKGSDWVEHVVFENQRRSTPFSQFSAQGLFKDESEWSTEEGYGRPAPQSTTLPDFNWGVINDLESEVKVLEERLGHREKDWEDSGEGWRYGIGTFGYPTPTESVQWSAEGGPFSFVRRRKWYRYRTIQTAEEKLKSMKDEEERQQQAESMIDDFDLLDSQETNTSTLLIKEYVEEGEKKRKESGDKKQLLLESASGSSDVQKKLSSNDLDLDSLESLQSSSALSPPPFRPTSSSSSSSARVASIPLQSPPSASRHNATSPDEAISKFFEDRGKDLQSTFSNISNTLFYKQPVLDQNRKPIHYLDGSSAPLSPSPDVSTIPSDPSSSKKDKLQLSSLRLSDDTVISKPMMCELDLDKETGSEGDDRSIGLSESGGKRWDAMKPQRGAHIADSYGLERLNSGDYYLSESLETIYRGSNAEQRMQKNSERRRVVDEYRKMAESEGGNQERDSERKMERGEKKTDENNGNIKSIPDSEDGERRKGEGLQGMKEGDEGKRDGEVEEEEEETEEKRIARYERMAEASLAEIQTKSKREASASSMSRIDEFSEEKNLFREQQRKEAKRRAAEQEKALQELEAKMASIMSRASQTITTVSHLELPTESELLAEAKAIEEKKEEGREEKRKKEDCDDKDEAGFTESVKKQEEEKSDSQFGNSDDNSPSTFAYASVDLMNSYSEANDDDDDDDDDIVDCDDLE